MESSTTFCSKSIKCWGRKYNRRIWSDTAKYETKGEKSSIAINEEVWGVTKTDSKN